MEIMKRLLKVIGIISVIFIAFIGILSVYNQIAIKAEAGGIVPNGQMIELGEYSVHVYSEGEAAAAPTLVFMSGSATVAPVYDFKSLYSLLSDEYRVAVIEKAGYGYSDIAEVDRDIATLVEEDRNALNSAGLNGPYVLLPHSMSGLEAIYWAQNYPNEVSGIIGIDMAVPDAYADGAFNRRKTRLMMTLGRISVDLGLLRIPGLYPLNEAALTDEEIIQQKLLMYRNAVNSVYIAEGDAVYENAQIVKAGGRLTCPILMFCSDGTEIGDFWVPVQKEFAEENQAEIVFFDCGHYIHYYKSEEMKEQIKFFLKQHDEKEQTVIS
ncbi:MAG: alpha/beta hydrolase [Clostridia bacterium]|nr:alpha/beta hydrolase [Clostridia bacterium]